MDYLKWLNDPKITWEKAIEALKTVGTKMNKGKMIEKGTHDELLTQNGNYYQMFKMQQGGLTEQL